MPGENLTHEEALERARVVTDVAYEVDLDLTGAAETFCSITTMTFSAVAGSGVFIDFIGAVRAVEFNGVHLDGADVYDGARIHLGALAEHNRVVITADASYVNTGQGLHRFVDPVDGATYLYSQFAVADCRRVFAVFDQPDIKAPLTLTVLAPSSWTVLSNERATATPAGEHACCHRFDRTPPLSSYLYAIVAGPYAGATGELTSRDGRTIPLGVYCRASLAEHLEGEHVMAVARAGFEFYEREFDAPYPFTKYDQVFVPEFNIGAMEHPGCVTFTDAYVFRSRVPLARRERRATTILHELAHMWFGDLVTMAWWDDLWLNESFATYMSTLAISEVDIEGFPQWAEQAWATFAASEKWWAYRQDQLPSTHPIVAPIRDLADVEVNFDGITYAKGASVLRQLVAYVGRDQFFAGVQAYFRRHAWGNTTLRDFLAALEQSSGRDLAMWSAQWLEQAGVTTVAAHLDSTMRSGRLEQSAPDEHPALRDHRLRVGLYATGPEGAGSPVRRIAQCELDLMGAGTDIPPLNATTDAPDLAGAPSFVLPNDDDFAYAKLRLDDRSWRSATQCLPQVADPVARSLIWGSAWDMTRDGQWPVVRFVDLVLTGLATETNSTVVQALFDQLATCLDLYTPPALRQRRRELVAPRLHELLLAAAPGSDLQMLTLLALAHHGVDDATRAYVDALIAGRTTVPGLTVDTDLRWDLLTCWIASVPPDASVDQLCEDRIHELSEADRTASGQLAAARARAAIPTRAAKRRAWAMVLDDGTSNSTQRSAMTGFQQVHDADLLTEFVPEYLAAIDGLWTRRSNKVAQRNVEGLYPLATVGIARAGLVDATRAWLTEHAGPRPALDRLVTENLAAAERARRVQAAEEASAP